MRRKVRYLTLSLCAIAASAAFALKIGEDIKPEWAAESGFLVTARSDDDGIVTFTVLRDLAKVHDHGPDSELVIGRTAKLSVYGDDGLIAECLLDPAAVTEGGNEQVSYWFRIARKHIVHSRFTIAEISDYKDAEKRGRLIGGGTFFEFALADFPVE